MERWLTLCVDENKQNGARYNCRSFCGPAMRKSVAINHSVQVEKEDTVKPYLNLSINSFLGTITDKRTT